jgi:hypothetical protein
MTAPTRRAALTALAGASALALPAAARTLTPGQADAELFALQGSIEAADRNHNAALDALSPAESAAIAARKKLPRPEQPESRFLAEEWFQTFTQKMAEDREKPWPEWDAYEEALGVWEEETARIKIESGEAAAEERSMRTLDEVIAIRDRIVGIRATTLAGLIFKARYAAAHYEGEWDQEVLTSIADDLLAMDGAASAA